MIRVVAHLTLALLPLTAAAASAPFLPSRVQFDALFPERISFYTYEGFTEAVRQTPGFADWGSDTQRRQEMAAFLGQIAHESDQLRAQREYKRENWDKYCRDDARLSCAKGQQYYGRGPIQLSWNYQYKAAGDFMGIDLWSDPDRVARDSTVAWRTALWYWMTQPGESSQTSHAAIRHGAGFGATTRAINGPLECDKPDSADARRKNDRRAEFYRHASQLLGVPYCTRSGADPAPARPVTPEKENHEEASKPRPTAIAAAAMLLTALPALAQEAPKKTESLEAVVVTGIRASMEKSLQTKRNADAIVDVITAEDVGKLPATNVAEALTTIPGVTIDKAFGQGEKVSILGTDPALNRTLINGQTIASADWFIADQPGRTFNYSLLAPQLINRVEVYKSPEAWLDEGSIGGTVNIATRKPLDQKALTLAASVGYLYNDRIGKGKPTLAGLVGWRNDAKTLGVIFSAQRSEEGIRRDGVESYGTVKGSDYINGTGGGGSINNLPTDWSVPANPDGSQPKKPATCVGSCATTLLANPNAIGPNSISAHYFEQTRKRDTLSLSLQARASDKLDFELNVLDVKAGYDNRSHSMFAFQGNAYNGLMKMTDLTVNGGVITKGTFKNALMVYDLIDRKATVDTNSYDLKGNFKDDRWFASFHAGASKATGGTKLQVYGEFLNWSDYSYDISSGTPRLNITGTNPLKDPSAFQIDGGWGSDPTKKETWNTGWGGNIVFKPTVDKEEFLQVDGGLKFDGPIYQLRFGAKHREHNTTQTMGGVSLASVSTYGDARASQFSPKQLPGNYLSGFGNVGDLSNRYTIDGEALAGYITSGKWLAPWQTMPQPATFNDPSFVANTWSVKEVVDAAYVQADYAIDALRGNFGVRVVDTTSNSGGWACTVSTGQACPADKYVATNVQKNYKNILPNLNVAYELNGNLILRASAAKVMSRPNYGDMSSYLWIGDQTKTGGGGNPDLKPYKSTNLDFSAEWYFAKNAILAGTIFNKKVTDYVLVTTQPEVHYNQFERQNTTYAVSRPNNAGSATIKGASLAFQANIAWGLGALTTYTFSDAESSQAGSHLPFNSKHQYSISPFYESDRFSARVTYTYRSKYYTQADRGNFLVTDGSKDLAASANFKLTNNLSLGLDAMNLLDSEYRNYADVAGIANTELLTRGIYRTGKRYQAVLRYNY